MAKLCRVNMDSYVWDFATGSAGLLVAAMHQMIQDAKENISSPKELEDKIESIKKEQILGIEVVAEIYMLAVLNMILMGDGSSNIIKGDSLKEYDGRYGYEKENESFPADVFLLNPPYSEAGNGMVFVKRALEMMSRGYAAVIIQDSAGSGQASFYNQLILKKNTLLASIKMPKDLFRGKSSVQTSIYVFKVGEKHEPKTRVRFIDFSNDGYKRSARKKAKAKKRLIDYDHAEERYKEVVNLVKYGASELHIFTSQEYVEDTIALKGNNYGSDWNFDQHRVKDDKLSFASYKKVIGDYLDWQVLSLNYNNEISAKDYFEGLKKLEQQFEDTGGIWINYKVDKLFVIDNTKAANRSNISSLSIPVITNSSKNNGITKTEKLMATEEGGIITYSDTTTTDAIFYQPSPFIGFSHVKKMTPIDKELWNENSCLFFISALKHQISGDFDYAHKLNKMGEIEVALPTKEGHIDFDYMNNYIQEMKRTHVKMIEGYFKTTLEKYNDIISADDQQAGFSTHSDVRILPEVQDEAKFVEFLPVYSIKAACGYFGEGEDVSMLGWIRVNGLGKLNSNMYVVQASGKSMEPRIHDGDFCVFSANPAGTRQGKIVLVQHTNYYDSDYAGAYSIKEYSSKKIHDSLGDWLHEIIELRPLNKNYDIITLTPEDGDEFRVVGAFVGKV